MTTGEATTLIENGIASTDEMRLAIADVIITQGRQIGEDDLLAALPEFLKNIRTLDIQLNDDNLAYPVASILAECAKYINHCADNDDDAPRSRFYRGRSRCEIDWNYLYEKIYEVREILAMFVLPNGRARNGNASVAVEDLGAKPDGVEVVKFDSSIPVPKGKTLMGD